MEIRRLVGMFALFFGIGIVWLVADAQPPTTQTRAIQRDDQVESKDFVIEPGASIKALKKYLNEHKLEFCENCLQVSQQEGSSHISITLDELTTSVTVHFVEASQKVEAVSMVFQPSNRTPRGGRAYLGAKRVALHEDRSFSVDFKAPPTKEDRERRRREAQSPFE